MVRSVADRTFQLQVYDEDLISANDLLGETEIGWKDLTGISVDPETKRTSRMPSNKRSTVQTGKQEGMAV